MAGDFDSIWAEPHGRKVLLGLLERTEMMEEISGSSFHIMTLGKEGNTVDRDLSALQESGLSPQLVSL